VANNYLQFAHTILVTSQEEYKWLLSLIEVVRGEMETEDFDDEGEALTDAGKIASEVWDLSAVDPLDASSAFSFEKIEEEGKLGVHFFAEESGDVEVLAHVIQAFLKRFNKDTGFIITWSETCSKMRDGAFGGGACVVTARGLRMESSNTWAMHMLKDMLMLKEMLDGP